MSQDYVFQLPTPRGPVQINIPHDDFKECMCGSTLFDLRYRVAWARPTAMIGAGPICFKAEIYCCSECGTELTPGAQTIREARTGDNGSSKP